jgi:simple sugar transport system ATP-binding protein
MSAAQYAVELRNISKAYSGGGKKANNNISLGLQRGEILCIAGENGAGKTTLMKILIGLETPNAGEILVNGKSVIIDLPFTARKLGIGMVHQHFMLFPEFTVAENIVLGDEPRRGGIFFDSKKARFTARKIIEAHHFSIVPDRPVHTLSIGEMQQVEICRILRRNADIIILDEPTAVLTEGETSNLFRTLKNLSAAGKSIIFITHKLREIQSVSDRVAVLRGGELAGIRDTAETNELEISRMMMGVNTEAVFSLYSPPPAVQKVLPDNEKQKVNSDPVIAFENVTVMRKSQKQPLLDHVSFSVKSGEIVGFAGVGGNGLGVIEAALGGFLHPVSGKITHNGKDISRLNIRRLRNQGLAFVPGDRLRVGSAPGAAVTENMIINRRREFFRFGFLDKKAAGNFCAEQIRRYRIEGSSSGEEKTASLSGGNLQQLILARETAQLTDYIVFSSPAWGLDITASAFVYREIAALREKGAAIILISTSLDEILALADRIIVMYRGRAAGEFAAGENLIKEKINACMQGITPNGAMP